jgi:peptidoglycan/LPS O-acetylase OafA/YrhL
MHLVREGRIATIDGLRGVAVLLVVWFHLWQVTWQAAVIPVVNVSLQPLAETGWLGVELFFFISGFVLMLPLAQARLTGSRPPSWRHFYERRFLKIVPSYALCIAVLLAIGYQTYANAWDGVRDVAVHLAFVHNWFATTYGTINGVLWSLGVEIQFYVLFPLLALAFLRSPLLATGAMVAVANAWRIVVIHLNHYYLDQREAQLPAFLDLFAAGMLCAYAYVFLALNRPLLTERRWIFTALAIAGAVGYWLLANDCYAIAHSQPDWPEPWKVQHRSLVALAISAVALGSLFAARWLRLVLANRVLLFLAAISYNLYLWHQPITRILLAHRFVPYVGADPHNDRVWMIVSWFVFVPAAIAVSALVTYGFEQPILRLRRRPRPTIVPTTSVDPV